MKITENTKLKNILSLGKGEAILKKHGVPCMSCPLAAQELGVLSIGDVSQIYKLDLKNILKDLNQK